MDPVLAALITEGEAIYADGDVARAARTSTKIHIDQVMRWIARSTNYISSTEPKVIHQVLSCRASDPFEIVLAAVFQMLMILKSLAPRAGRTASTGESTGTSSFEGEPPDLVKWMMWLWNNRKKHPVWTAFAAFVVAAILAIGALGLRSDMLAFLNPEIRNAGEIRQILYEMNSRARQLQLELTHPSSWAKNLIVKNFHSLHYDPMFSSCSTSCLGNKLLSESSLERGELATAMKDTKIKTDEVERRLLRVISSQDPSPLTEMEASELRPASNALLAALAHCIAILDGIKEPPRGGW